MTISHAEALVLDPDSQSPGSNYRIILDKQYFVDFESRLATPIAAACSSIDVV